MRILNVILTARRPIRCTLVELRPLLEIVWMRRRHSARGKYLSTTTSQWAPGKLKPLSLSLYCSSAPPLTIMAPAGKFTVHHRNLNRECPRPYGVDYQSWSC